MEDEKKIIRSKTKRKGLNKKRLQSLDKCGKCATDTPRIQDVIVDITKLPSDLVKLVDSYLIRPNQHVGYFHIHPPSRRACHIVCVACHVTILNESMNYIQHSGIAVWNGRIGTLVPTIPTCVHDKCKRVNIWMQYDEYCIE